MLSVMSSYMQTRHFILLKTIFILVRKFFIDTAFVYVGTNISFFSCSRTPAHQYELEVLSYFTDKCGTFADYE